MRSDAAPFSSGRGRASLVAPANACDAHVHFYDNRFPPAPGATLRPPDATVDGYGALQRRLGTSRVVAVTPSTYGTDNRVMLAALRCLGRKARGVAVVDVDVPDSELDRLHSAGVRGVRFQGFRASPAFKFSALAKLSARLAERGWHLQLHLSADVIADHADLLHRLPSSLVIDHLGRLPQPQGVAHPAFTVLRALLDAGRAWVKLSGAYHDSRIGPPTFADVGIVAKALVSATPERLVWGSDWPYPSASAGECGYPDAANLFDLLIDWAPSTTLQEQILVTNPKTLYGFDTN